MTKIAGCAACGADIRADARFCWRCGSAIQRPANGAGKASSRCPACGHANPAGATVCSSCTRQLFEAARAAAENSAKAGPTAKPAAPARIGAAAVKPVAVKPAAERADASPFRNSRPGVDEGTARPASAPIKPPTPAPVAEATSGNYRQRYFRWGISSLTALLAVAGALLIHGQSTSPADTVARSPGPVTADASAGLTVRAQDNRGAVPLTSSVQAEQTGETTLRGSREPEPAAAVSSPAELNPVTPAPPAAASATPAPATATATATAVGATGIRAPNAAASTQRKRAAEPPAVIESQPPLATEPAPQPPAAAAPAITVAAAPAVAPQDPCASLSGLAQQQCRACSGLGQPRRFFCEEGVRLRYCSGRWGATAECPHTAHGGGDGGG